jgi:hypothetical protein
LHRDTFSLQDLDKSGTHEQITKVTYLIKRYPIRSKFYTLTAVIVIITVVIVIIIIVHNPSWRCVANSTKRRLASCQGEWCRCDRCAEDARRLWRTECRELGNDFAWR